MQRALKIEQRKLKTWITLGNMSFNNSDEIKEGISPANLGGMGEISFPTSEQPGSGDVPAGGESEEDEKDKKEKGLMKANTFEQFNQLNEGFGRYEYDRWTKKNGKIKWPKWCKPLMKELIEGGFMESFYDAEYNYIYLMWNKLGEDIKFDTDKRKKALGKQASELISDHYNDIVGYTAFAFEGAMIALELSKYVDDQLANMEMPEPAYYVAKEYFKNHGLKYQRSRIFNAAVDKLEKWYKDNNVQTL